MRAFMCSVCIMMAAASASAQKPAADTAGKRASRTLTLTGCVDKGSLPNQFTLADEQNGKYQLSGRRIGRYVGQRVEMAGMADGSKLTVKGGLWPTPNVAGQAGAMDPARAAVAALPGGPASGTGEIDLPKFVVKSVRALDGRCR